MESLLLVYWCHQYTNEPFLSSEKKAARTISSFCAHPWNASGSHIRLNTSRLIKILPAERFTARQALAIEPGGLNSFALYLRPMFGVLCTYLIVFIFCYSAWTKIVLGAPMNVASLSVMRIPWWASSAERSSRGRRTAGTLTRHEPWSRCP
jgi:hypothetical protein